eukprot:TRINITY_DN7538_c0_g1_i1.p1 TRINITY_DN7538_c0_g1~~TRINITY_DN7538_c0_g1_i1.p1  ORF type:complete len:227 (-),score=34.40 TRINITY_DN7538_c0_g1_i1:91-771(-)
MPRESFSAVLHRRTVYFFGGACAVNRNDYGITFGDLWALHLPNEGKISKNSILIWEKIENYSGVPPTPRWGHTGVLMPDRNSMLIYGGTFSTEKCFSDVFLYNFDQNLWTTVKVSGTSPQLRQRTTGTVVGTTLYILGGLLLQRDFEQTSEINLLDLSNFSWSSSLKLRNFSEILSDEILRRYGHSITTTGKGSFVCVGGSGNHSKSYKSLLNDVIFLKQWEPLDL